MGRKAREKKQRRQAPAERPVQRGELREASIAIGLVNQDGEKDDRLTGLMIDNDKLIGVAPGSPAASMDPAELARISGLDWENPRMPGSYAYPMPPDGDLHMEPIPLPAKRFAISTPMLANMSEIARSQPWCTKALPASTVERLHMRGKHLVVTAWRHTTEDFQRDNVRVHMTLAMAGGKPHENPATAVMVDLPTHQFGIMLAAYQARDRGFDSRLEGTLLPDGYGRLLSQPHWAAGRSFAKVWREAHAAFTELSTLQVAGDRLADEFVLSQGMETEQAKKLAAQAREPVVAIGATAFNALASARLVVVEPEWVQGVNDKRPDDDKLWEWAGEAHLPFDCIYLDMEGPGGLMPTVPINYRHPDKRVSELLTTVRLAGALMWRDGDELSVVPFGTPRPEKAEGYQALGRLVIGCEQPTSSRVPVSVDGTPTPIMLPVGPVPGEDRRGRVEFTARLGLDEHAEEMRAAATAILYAGAQRALRVLYMLQASNVELVEAKLHGEGRRLLKRALKRDWPVEIGLMVAVRWKRKLYLRPPGTEQLEAQNPGRGYSHAFWVQGHPAFYPLGTRIADKLAEESPEKLVEDPTPANRGLGRLVWRPPYVKGLYDPDTGVEREAVEKARKMVGDPYAEDATDAAA